MNSNYIIPLAILFLISVNLALIFSEPTSDSLNTVDFEFSVIMDSSENMHDNHMHMIHNFVESGKENPSVQVQEGDLVTIYFKNTDSMMKHDFVIPEFDVQTELLDPGEIAEIQFEATKSGKFDYFCSIHSDQMNGSLVVTM